MEPILSGIVLPRYDSMKLAALDGWDLKDEQGEPWLWPYLELPKEIVFKSHLQAFVQARDIEMRRFGSGKRKRLLPAAPPCRAWGAPPPRQRFKTWLDYTATDS